MKIGLVDVDGHNFPNLCLMKISAYHKAQGDEVHWEWAKPSTHFDCVYISRVFDDEYSADFPYTVNADMVIKGGTGYDLKNTLPKAIEHQYPDYTLYPRHQEAYGFLTRGCPRNCGFCIVSQKEGCKSRQVATLTEFWRGQKEIKLLDPNLLAAKEHETLLRQLIQSKAWVDITQGLDARLLNKDNIALLQQVKTKMVHFAWDGEKDTDNIIKGLQRYKAATNCDPRKAAVYVLTNYDTSFDFDLYRINTLRAMGYHPYVMIYNKTTAPRNVRLLQRWVNNRIIWNQCERFEDYKPEVG